MWDAFACERTPVIRDFLKVIINPPVSLPEVVQIATLATSVITQVSGHGDVWNSTKFGQGRNRAGMSFILSPPSSSPETPRSLIPPTFSVSPNVYHNRHVLFMFELHRLNLYHVVASASRLCCSSRYKW